MKPTPAGIVPDVGAIARSATDPDPSAIDPSIDASAPLPNAMLSSPLAVAAGPTATLSVPTAWLSGSVELAWKYLIPAPLLIAVSALVALVMSVVFAATC